LGPKASRNLRLAFFFVPVEEGLARLGVAAGLSSAKGLEQRTIAGGSPENRKRLPVLAGLIRCLYNRGIF
jgi:hypothetical protein